MKQLVYRPPPVTLSRSEVEPTVPALVPPPTNLPLQNRHLSASYPPGGGFQSQGYSSIIRAHYEDRPYSYHGASIPFPPPCPSDPSSASVSMPYQYGLMPLPPDPRIAPEHAAVPVAAQETTQIKYWARLLYANDSFRKLTELKF